MGSLHTLLQMSWLWSVLTFLPRHAHVPSDRAELNITHTERCFSPNFPERAEFKGRISALTRVVTSHFSHLSSRESFYNHQGVLRSYFHLTPCGSGRNMTTFNLLFFNYKIFFYKQPEKKGIFNFVQNCDPLNNHYCLNFRFDLIHRVDVCTNASWK